MINFLVFRSMLLGVFFSLFSIISLGQNEKEKNRVVQFNNDASQYFQSNAGRWDKQILYRLSTGDAAITFMENGISFAMKRPVNQNIDSLQQPQASIETNLKNIKGIPSEYLVWDITFLGSNKCRPKGTQSVHSVYRFFGNGSVEGKSIELYEKIVFENIYPGIDMVFYSDGENKIKYDFIIHPHANASAIKLKYTGINSLGILPNNALSIQTAWGKLAENAPISYQEKNNSRQEVNVGYHLYDSATLGFRINGTYNANVDLIIDPILLDWSTYFYGHGSIGGQPRFYGLEVDKDLNVYFGGHTLKDDYPVIPGYYDTSYNGGNTDAFYCKLANKGDSLIFFNFIGGNSYDQIRAFTLSSKNEAVISGQTSSNDFPITKDAYDSTTVGEFVLKFNPKGDRLIFSTFFGSLTSIVQTITLSKSGDIYIGGDTKKDGVPITSNAYQKTYGGGDLDGFIACLKGDGKSLVFSTYFGGSGFERINSILLNKTNEILVCGLTESSDFPNTSTNPAYNKKINGPFDAFVSKLDTHGSKVRFSNLIGGSGSDVFSSMHLNEKEEVFIAGGTNSNDFPVSGSAYQKSNNGKTDATVLKLSANGAAMLYSTYLGGNKDDAFNTWPEQFREIKVISNIKDEAIIIGVTTSRDFPITNDAIQNRNKTTGNSSSNLFISKLSFKGDKLLYSTYFGGNTFDGFPQFCLKRILCETFLFVAGTTYSTDFPVTKGSYLTKPVQNSNNSGFITKFIDSLFTEKPDFGSRTKIRCNSFLEILDGLNNGSRRVWSNGDSTRYLLVDKPGSYWVQATYGCDTVRDSSTILNPINKASYSSSDTAACFNNHNFHFKETAFYKDDSSSLIKWFINDSLVSVDSILSKKFSKPATYQIKLVTQSKSLCLDSVTRNIKVFPSPKVDFGIYDSIQCLRYNAFDFVNTSQNPDSVNYVWDLGDKTWKAQKDTYNKTYTKDGNYRITLVATTPNNCNDSFQKTITVLPDPRPEFTWFNPCNLSETSFKYLGKIPIKTFHWNFDGEDLSTLQNPSKQFMVAGIKKVTLIVNSIGGCTDTIAKSIEIKQQSKADFDVSTVCESDSAVFVNHSMDANRYRWKFGDGETSTLKAPKHRFKTSGVTQTFNVVLVAVIDGGCSDSIVQQVSIDPTPDSDFIFFGGNKKVTFLASKGGVNYHWVFGDGKKANSTTNDYTYTYMAMKNYKVCLTVTNSFNCLSETCKEVVMVSGIEKLNKASQIQIYPNPNTGNFTLIIADPQPGISITVYNVLGQLIKTIESNPLNSTYSIDLNVANGHYIVKVINDGKSCFQRITVHKD